MIYYRYYEYPHGWHKVLPHYGIRTERYKLIHFENEPGYWGTLRPGKDPDKVEQPLPAKIRKAGSAVEQAVAGTAEAVSGWQVRAYSPVKYRIPILAAGCHGRTGGIIPMRPCPH